MCGIVLPQLGPVHFRRGVGLASRVATRGTGRHVPGSSKAFRVEA